MKILVNFCISKVDITVMEGRITESSREFQSLTVKNMEVKILVNWSFSKNRIGMKGGKS